MDSEKLLKAAVFLAIALGIFAWAFSIALMPESAFNDSLYHLKLAERISEKGFSDNSQVLNQPFFHYLNPLEYHFFLAVPILLFGFNSLIFKAFNFIIAGLFLVVCFFLFRKLLPKNHLIAFAFIVANPLLITYFSVNYPDGLAAFIAVLAVFLLLKLKESKSNNRFLLLSLLFIISLVAMIYAKANLWVLIPVFFAWFIYLIFQREKPNSIIRGAFFLIFSLLVVIILIYFALQIIGALPSFSPEFFASIYFNFFYFPIGTFFNYLSLPVFLVISLIFLLATLPLVAAIFKGIGMAKQIGENWLFLSFSCLALFIFTLFTSDKLFYSRYLIPVIPFFAILLALGFEGISKNLLKNAIMVSLVFFSIFGLAFTSYSAVSFRQNFESQKDFYSFLSSLPEDSRIIVPPNDERRVEFYSGIKPVLLERELNAGIGIDAELKKFNDLENSALIAKLKAFGATHIGNVCYKDFWNPEKLSSLENAGLIQLQFQGKCSKVFSIK